MNPVPLDGNATAGSLGELFTFDVTIAVTTCTACGDRRPAAELVAHTRAPGIVLRCFSCGAVQVRMVRAPGRAWLDLRGVDVMEVTLPEE